MHDLFLLIVPPEHREELALMSEGHRGFKIDLQKWPPARIHAASYGLDTCMPILRAIRYGQPSDLHAHPEYLKTQKAFFVGSSYSSSTFNPAPATGKVLDIHNTEIPRAPMTPETVTTIQQLVGRAIVPLRDILDDVQRALEIPNTAKILGGTGPYQRPYIVSADQGDPALFRQWSAYHLAQTAVDICLVWI